MSDPIKEYFFDREIFVTGATGIFGKALVEKLLRSCPGLKTMFILIRNKRGENCDERLSKLKSSKIFDVIRKTNPNVLDKITAMEGDITLDHLGLSDKDYENTKNVSVVIHCAATIKFDEPLKVAIRYNVRGTFEVLRFAEKLPKINKFLHVSTTYSNPYVSYVKEEVYPAAFSWETALKMTNTTDELIVNSMTKKILGKFPNTYTLTKHMAENVVNDFRHRVPVVIYRPSIIIQALQEPFPGWTDSYIGPVGIIAAVYSGLLRCIYCDKNTVLDMSPLDDTVKTSLVTLWKDATLPPLLPDESVRVYNSATTDLVTLSIKEVFVAASELIEEMPFNKTLWYPRVQLTNSKFLFAIELYLFHLLPAIILDGLLKLFRQEPVLLRIHRKIFSSTRAVEFFLFRRYAFENTKLREILDEIKQYPDFRYDQMIHKTTREYVNITLSGIRKYLFHEENSSISAARKRFQILKYTDYLMRSFLLYWIMKLIITKLNAWADFSSLL